MTNDVSTRQVTLDMNGHRMGYRTLGTEVTVIRSHGIDRMVTHLFDCAVCDAYPDVEITDDLAKVKEPCTLTEGITTEVTIAVPSGKLVVTDDLRPLYNWRSGKGYASYNSKLGQAQVISYMASLGCAYGPVGNSCPSLYRTGEDTYVIGKLGYDEDDEEVGDLGEELASICTDLWAYSIADHDDWVAKGGDLNHREWAGRVTVVDVTPGTYRFTHHTGEVGFTDDTSDPVIYAHIERVIDENKEK